MTTELEQLRDRLVKAEAERDAQHDLALRLTAERDALRMAGRRLLDTLAKVQWMEPHKPEDVLAVQAVHAWLQVSGLALYADLSADLDEARAQVWGLMCVVGNFVHNGGH